MKDKSRVIYFYPHSGSNNVNCSSSSYSGFKARYGNRAILLYETKNDCLKKKTIYKLNRTRLITFAKV